jgi:hypothetical protein
LIYLVEYCRPDGRLVTFKTFDPSEKTHAQNVRLQLELYLNRKGINHEVVILEAANENDLRRTRRRYFDDLSQIAKSFGDSRQT